MVVLRPGGWHGVGKRKPGILKQNPYYMKKKTFDAVAFMRQRREELSRAYAGLTAEQIEERVQQSLKNNPLWKKPPRGKGARDGT